VTADTIRAHAASLALDDAHVIVLGGREYVDLITGAVPHAFAPLTGHMLAHRSQCRTVREDPELAASWWDRAARSFDEQHATQP